MSTMTRKRVMMRKEKTRSIIRLNRWLRHRHRHNNKEDKILKINLKDDSELIFSMILMPV